MVIGHWSLVIGHWSLVIGDELKAYAFCQSPYIAFGEWDVNIEWRKNCFVAI
ncbi:MAG: hypothetical protein F6K31_18915 [Symploca sp. SIO2G7]|nr:hypothetical protein [Symploca sp. SIO2G7]